MSAARVVPNSKTRAGILRAIEVWEQCGSNHLSPRETLRLFDERAELLSVCEELMEVEDRPGAGLLERVRAAISKAKGEQ